MTLPSPRAAVPQLCPEWGQVMKAARGALYPFAATLSEPVRDEIVQESALRCLVAMGVRDRCAYVRRVARNLAIDVLRERGRWGALPTEPEDHSFPDGIVSAIDYQRIVFLFGSGPAGHRRGFASFFDEPIPEPRARDRAYKQRSRAVRWARQHLQLTVT